MGFASGGSCSNALNALGLHGGLALSTADFRRWVVELTLQVAARSTRPPVRGLPERVRLAAC